jgi:hypothetical protein
MSVLEGKGCTPTNHRPPGAIGGSGRQPNRRRGRTGPATKIQRNEFLGEQGVCGTAHKDPKERAKNN